MKGPLRDPEGRANILGMSDPFRNSQDRRDCFRFSKGVLAGKRGGPVGGVQSLNTF